MEWLKNISKAINYIESNLTDDISYDEAAKIACCSTYYFGRLFSCIAGITLSEYIRRRRMTAAAFELQKGDVKVMDIALKYGYNSPTAFNRAFQSVHGVSPVAARTKGIQLNSYPPISFSILVTGGENMNYRIERKEAIRIVGVRTTLKEDMDENQKIVPIFWSKVLQKNELLSNISKLIEKDSDGIFGVTAYENPKDIYYYIAVPTNKPIPKGMVEIEIPAATWVVFESNGRFKESVQTIFKKFLTEWLPFSGYEYAEMPDVEVYPIGNEESKCGHVEVWIAVK